MPPINFAQSLTEQASLYLTWSHTSEDRFSCDVILFCPLDREPPRIHTCPDDIYVFEDEVVTWEEPEYSDNVGVYYKKCNKENRDRTYPVGVYNITYTYVDFEYNYAICDFMINVTKRGKIVSKVICQIVTLLIIVIMTPYHEA